MDNNIFRDLSSEQLEEIKVKFPQYVMAIEEEEARREELNLKAMEAIEEQARRDEANNKVNELISDTIAEIFPIVDNQRPEGFTNLLITVESVEYGDVIEVEVGGKTESRRPSKLAYVVYRDVQWQKFGSNKTKPGTSGKGETSKRAQSIYKFNGDKNEFIGNFRSGSEGCDYLKLEHAGNSANRVLRDNGYILQPYEGSEFTISK